MSVSHSLGDLARDMDGIVAKTKAELPRIVGVNALRGRNLARENVRRDAPIYGVHYDDSITAEKRGSLSWEYGPDPALPQGGMSFEYGSRNQKPHLDLARSADRITPVMARDVRQLVDRLFW